ncbi:hypothetical protein CHU98_g3853 [Xylaria longipes]|nr:hypothetical protein CHU98_g3853 [Xylaria longipes]
MRSVSLFTTMTSPWKEHQASIDARFVFYSPNAPFERAKRQDCAAPSAAYAQSYSGRLGPMFHEPRMLMKFDRPGGELKRSAFSLFGNPTLALSEGNESSDPGITTRPEREGSTSSRIPPFKNIVPTKLKPVTFKSSVASWMIDIIGGCPTIPSPNRYPILKSINVAFLREWLQNCDKDHSHSTFNSFRGLSYVWGQSVDQQESLRAMRISKYALTIRDAAGIAKSIGFEWLWVDRICIDQTNEAEKSALIPYIKDIFAGAELTIVAASGDGAHCGLSGSENTARAPEIAAEIPLGRLGWTGAPFRPAETPDRFILRLLPAPLSFNALHEDCVWRTRGWTFQEQVFSRRLLYVFPSEMIFSCSKGTYREATGTHFDPNPAGTT